MDKIILHSDLNGFYASVECLYNPEIRNKPVAVCGNVEERHGIVLAKNEAAKKFKIKTGEVIWQAKQKYPELITIDAHFERYMRFSRLAKEIYYRYTNQVESFGLDECWLDVTESSKLFGSGKEIAEDIRKTISEELGLTVSVGVSWNKIFAKLGSDMKKPDAVTVITKENYRKTVWNLPAGDLLYVGRSTEKKLLSYGIHTIGEIANLDLKILTGLLGKCGESLWIFANGFDESPVADIEHECEIKSIGNSMTTYRDMQNNEDVWCVIVALSESVAKRLRESGFLCKTVQISIRDNALNFIERQAKLEAPSNIASDIAKTAMAVFISNYRFGLPIRSIGVRGCDLISKSEIFQLDIFNTIEKKIRKETLERSIDEIRSRFGLYSLQRAVLIKADIVKGDSKIQHEIHPVSYWR